MKNTIARGPYYWQALIEEGLINLCMDFFLLAVKYYYQYNQDIFELDQEL